MGGGCIMAIMASLALIASAKPRHVLKVGFANGRIIGGHEADPRKPPMSNNSSAGLKCVLYWITLR